MKRRLLKACAALLLIALLPLHSYAMPICGHADHGAHCTHHHAGNGGAGNAFACHGESCCTVPIAAAPPQLSIAPAHGHNVSEVLSLPPPATAPDRLERPPRTA